MISLEVSIGVPDSGGRGRGKDSGKVGVPSFFSASFWRHFLSDSQLRLNSESSRDEVKVCFNAKKRI
jgi:hypothetical protein